MRILGLCHDVLICSAAVVEDGEVVAAVAEERLDHVKQSRVFPSQAIDWCLRQAGWEMSDVDEIAVGWNPAIELETIPSGFLARRDRSEHLTQVPARLMRAVGGSASSVVTQSGLTADLPPITYLDHYLSHVGNAVGMSGYDECAVAILDGRAERQTGLLGAMRGSDLEVFTEIDFPHSLGLLYGAITQFLGFKPDSDEWKVMALASFGTKDDNPFYRQLRDLVRVDESGRFELDLVPFSFFNHYEPNMYSDRFVDLFGDQRQRDDEILPRHQDLAAAMQLVFEDVAAEVLTALHRQCGLPRLAVSGGSFMNSVFNGKIEQVTPFDDVFISSCPDDSGTSVGAALYLHQLRTGQNVKERVAHNYWGPSFSDEECLADVRRYRLAHDIVDDPSTSAAEDLVEGRLVGWFQGSLEFGQRALGNRSILCDPRRADGKDVINAAVKYRESFRPFAPAILTEHSHDWFDCEPGTHVPFMERVLDFRPEMADQVPAVVHEDGTGRLQSVDGLSSPRYRRLIEVFHEKTGVPIVLNTSFNLNGEPIVCTPTDAIRTFFSCGLDALYLGNVRLTKQ